MPWVWYFHALKISHCHVLSAFVKGASVGVSGLTVQIRLLVFLVQVCLWTSVRDRGVQWSAGVVVFWPAGRL